MRRAGETAVAHVDRFTPVAVDALAGGLSVTFRAGGDSMRPAIRDGDVIHVAPASAADIRVGDVVLCRVGSRLLAHRLVAVTEDADGERWLHLRGDAKGGCDAPVRDADVIGRVEAVWRDGSTRRVVDRGVVAKARRLFSVIIQPG
jgi:signal peptidase I